MKRLFVLSVLGTSLVGASPAWSQPAGEQAVEVAADVVEATRSDCTVVYRGDAEALQGNRRLRADTLKAILERGSGEACGGIVRMEAQGNVYAVTPQQAVRGDAAVYDLVNETVVMTGDVVAVQDRNVLTGTRMTIDLKTGEGRMTGTGRGRGQSGRPRGVFYPKASSASPAQ